MYVNVKHDQDTEISTLEMDQAETESECEEDTYSPRRGYPRHMYDTKFGGSSSVDVSVIHPFTTYQPDGVLEATILRTDSDSTRDMSMMGAEAHVSVYNLSEKMSYDLREAGRSFSVIATKVAQACSANPNMIKM